MTEAFRRGYVDQMQKLAGLTGSFLGRNTGWGGKTTDEHLADFGERAYDYFHTGKYKRDLYNAGSAVSASVMPITRLFSGLADKRKNKIQAFSDATE